MTIVLAICVLNIVSLLAKIVDIILENKSAYSQLCSRVLNVNTYFHLKVRNVQNKLFPWPWNCSIIVQFTIFAIFDDFSHSILVQNWVIKVFLKTFLRYIFLFIFFHIFNPFKISFLKQHGLIIEENNILSFLL